MTQLCMEKISFYFSLGAQRVGGLPHGGFGTTGGFDTKGSVSGAPRVA